MTAAPHSSAGDAVWESGYLQLEPFEASVRKNWWRLRRCRLPEQLAPGMRVLDLCCGHGATLVPLGARGVDAVGLDLSPALLRMAQSKGLRKLVCGDSTVLPFRSGAFHVVTIQGGFHHLWADQFERALAEIVRVLKPGGYLAFTEPANTWVLRLYVRLVDGPLANLTAYTRNWRLTLEQERPTYFHWLKTQDRALASLAGRMELVQLKKGLVTLFGLARRRTEASAR